MNVFPAIFVESRKQKGPCPKLPVYSIVLLYLDGMKRYLHEIRKLLFRLSGKGNYVRDHHVSLFEPYNNINSYSSLYKKCTSNNCLKTNVEICFSQPFKLGSTLRDVKKVLNEPNYHLKNSTPLHIEILLYKRIIDKHKVRCHVHFFENKMFLCNYTFSYLNEYDINEMITTIQKKYLSDINNYTEQIIIDNFNNCVQVEKSVNFTINYISLDCDFFKKLFLLSEGT